MDRYEKEIVEERIIKCLLIFLLLAVFAFYFLFFAACKSTMYYYRNGFTCGKCNETYSTYVDYCQNCGESMERCNLKCTEFCFNCNRLALDEKYCSKCGEEIREDVKTWNEFSKRRQWNIRFFANLQRLDI